MKRWKVWSRKRGTEGGEVRGGKGRCRKGRGDVQAEEEKMDDADKEEGDSRRTRGGGSRMRRGRELRRRRSRKRGMNHR